MGKSRAFPALSILRGCKKNGAELGCRQFSKEYEADTITIVHDSLPCDSCHTSKENVMRVEKEMPESE